MGEADSRAPGWMGGVDLLVELPEGVARLWVSSGHLIRKTGGAYPGPGILGRIREAVEAFRSWNL